MECIIREKAEIAILDIRMPGLSGLEACEMLKKINPDIQLILISGYAEFSYAQQAMEYGVLGYCLKPLDYSKLSGLLIKAVNVLEMRRGVETEEDVTEIIQSAEPDKIKALLEQSGLTSDRYGIAVLSGDGRLDMEGAVLCIGLGGKQNAYLMNWVPDQQFLWREMVKQNEVEIKVRGIGFLTSPCSADELKNSMHRCAILACRYFISGKPEVCFESEKTTPEVFLEISEYLGRHRYDAVIRSLENIRKSGGADFDVESAVRLGNLIYSSDLFRGEEADYYIYDYHQMIGQYGCFSAFLDALEQEIRTALQGQAPGRFTNSAFMDLLTYVSSHYKENISLGSAGEALHMNPNYVSQLFRKEAGISFVHYVTKLRMDEAERLLVTTSQPVTQIADEVGYQDYFYFLKNFRKITGKTPTQYRKDH